MTKFLGSGGASVFAAAMLLTVGGSGQALAQQVKNLPVVQAVASTATSPVRVAATAAVSPAVAASATSAAPVASAITAALPLSTLVAANSVGAALDEQGKCLATAVYFESMGESLEGQLAVANVVINRARSGQYPSTWCGVVKQKAQFSFVRGGRFPRVDSACEAWRNAQAIARIASANLATALPDDVLWYHADYVAPSWGHRLSFAQKIGQHIFYR